jgi:hypothetical protein
MNNDDPHQALRFDRSFKYSLYNCGYTDGYGSKGLNARWIPEGECETGACYAACEKERTEYDEGYKDGKFHSEIDKK